MTDPANQWDRGQGWRPDYKQLDKSGPKLDLDKPASFSEWQSRTHRWMCGASLVIHRILESLRARSEPLTVRDEHELGVMYGLHPAAAAVVSRELADAICNTGESNVAQLSQRLGMAQGLSESAPRSTKYRK